MAAAEKGSDSSEWIMYVLKIKSYINVVLSCSIVVVVE